MGSFQLAARCGATAATGPVKLAVRPERVVLHPFGTDGPNHVPGMVERIVFLGSASQVFLTLAPGATIQALVTNAPDDIAWRQGTPVSAELPAEWLRVLPGQDGPTLPAPSARPGLPTSSERISDDPRPSLYE